MNENVQLNESQVSKLREKEIEILTIFISICRQLNLKYFIVQGTLIGAVRHQGFIPWDDDIDVGMLREDYDVFISKAQEYLPEGFFLQTNETDPHYPHCFAKIRNSNTAFIETTCKNIPMNHGIYIDIFPFDYYPKNAVQKKWFDLKKLLMRYRVRPIYYIPSDNKPTFANMVRKVITCISKIIYKTPQDAVRAQAKLIGSVRKTDVLINNGSPWGNREVIPAKWVENVVQMKFEGLTVNAPQNFDGYLRSVYGDYMILPPVEKRVAHHYVSVIDFENSYKTFFDQLQQKNS